MTKTVFNVNYVGWATEYWVIKVYKRYSRLYNVNMSYEHYT
jgi:hypothetical protein